MKHLTRPEHCSSWLKQEHSLLQSYQKKTQQLLHLNALWNHQTDQALASNSCIANFEDAKLVIEVQNASWGTRLHYCIPDLLIQLQTWEALKGLEKITWYIRPQNHHVMHRPFARTIPRLSQEVRQLLQAVANTVVHDELKTALHHLAHAKR